MVLTPAGHGLGWIKQPTDSRDYLFVPSSPVPLPPTVDLRSTAARPPIWDQGRLGSCTAHASGRIAQQTYTIDGNPNAFEPSRLFIYWNTRVIEQTTATDSGGTMRDAMTAIAQQGICPETIWPYSDVNPGPFSVQPPPEAYQAAKVHLATQYQAVPQDETLMKTCLAQGYPFMVGIVVYQSFEGPQASATGMVPLPGSTGAADPQLGGHAVTVEGYDDTRQVWILDNSWGPGWGDKGSFYLPYSYLLDPALASDFWTIRTQN